MVPRADIPRSSFRMQKTLKTAFDSGYLIPIFCEEILPGDTFSVNMTAFCRLATPIFPFMDNLHLESFFFFVPNRLVWHNWEHFMGQQENPGDSTSYTIPQVVAPAGGWPTSSLGDYFGLPTVGQVAPGAEISHNVLPLRGYMKIWNSWFRDENLQSSGNLQTGEGPDPNSIYGRYRRGKRHDYFTASLPWVQKGPSVGLPLGSTAPVIPLNDAGGQPTPTFRGAANPALAGRALTVPASTNNVVSVSGAQSTTAQSLAWDFTALQTDLSAATAATINQIRQAFQIQKLLERDARGGTRYTEIIRSHFGVVSPDARLQRPEYLGGGYTPVSINPVAQTAPTDTTTPQGNLAAFGTALARGHAFSQSFTEHGYIIGLINVRADLTYQQGLRRMWSKRTKFDFYWPVFNALGEQPVYSKEIYCDGTAEDETVWGYQERFAEYRYNPNEITGLMRSTAPGTIDAWHLAQRFTTRPQLNSAFIADTPPIQRVVAVAEEALGQEFIGDFFFDIKAARPMPMYGVPGLIDHF